MNIKWSRFLRQRVLFLRHRLWLACSCQWHDFRERSRQGTGDRRGAADGARRARPQPWIHAVEMEEVAALRQQPQHVRVLIVGEAYGTASRRRAPLLELSLRVEDLRVAHQRGLVEACLHVHVRRHHVVGRPTGPRRGGGSGGRGPCAEVGHECYGGYEEKDAGGDAEAIGQPAHALRWSAIVRVEAGAIAAAAHQVLWKGREDSLACRSDRPQLTELIFNCSVFDLAMSTITRRN
ncbi:hypothetical protein BHM03_00001126 [Ensete ventricosum]|nr:hypothetical protein BHM03_00001126 [Ensete ventricosum]